MSDVTPRVSVVVPTYQRAGFLSDVIGMLLTQTLGDIEVIVADDGSTDETPNVVRRFADPRLRYLRREHVGMPRILNEGFAAARGAYVMTCHDHDVYEPSLLEELAASLDRFPSAAYAHCGVVGVDPSGMQVLERYVYQFAPLTPGRTFLVDHLLPGLDSKVSALTMIRASALAGRFDPAYGFVADVEMWLRLAAHGDVAYVARPLIRVRQRDASSEMYHVTPQLVLHTLRAKRAYLHLVADYRRRREIERGWRRQTMATVLRELLHVQRHRHEEALADIRALAIEAGSTPARFVIRICSSVPRTISVRILGLFQRAVRAWRHAAGAPSEMPAL